MRGGEPALASTTGGGRPEEGSAKAGDGGAGATRTDATPDALAGASKKKYAHPPTRTEAFSDRRCCGRGGSGGGAPGDAGGGGMRGSGVAPFWQNRPPYALEPRGGGGGAGGAGKAATSLALPPPPPPPPPSLPADDDGGGNAAAALSGTHPAQRHAPASTPGVPATARDANGGGGAHAPRPRQSNGHDGCRAAGGGGLTAAAAAPPCVPLGGGAAAPSEEAAPPPVDPAGYCSTARNRNGTGSGDDVGKYTAA